MSIMLEIEKQKHRVIEEEVHKSPSFEILLSSCRKNRLEADAIADFPRDFWLGQDIMAANTFLLSPEEGGGATSRSIVRSALMSELLGSCDPALAIAMPGAALTLPLLRSLASPEQKAELLSRFRTPERPVWSAFALTEPQTGSDPASLVAQARPTAGGYLLDGEKWFIGCADRADFLIVFCRLASTFGRFGTRAFVVNKTNPGMEVTIHSNVLGLRAVRIARVVLRDCFVPHDALLAGDDGPSGKDAFSGAMETFNFMRPILSGTMVGCMVAVLEELEAHAGEETGTASAILQASIAQMRAQVQGARLLVHQAAWRYDHGLAMGREASIAKAHCARLAMQIAHRALTLTSMKDEARWSILEKLYRDAKAFDILEGTGDIQRISISRRRMSINPSVTEVFVGQRA